MKKMTRTLMTGLFLCSTFVNRCYADLAYPPTGDKGKEFGAVPIILIGAAVVLVVSLAVVCLRKCCSGQEKK